MAERPNYSAGIAQLMNTPVGQISGRSGASAVFPDVGSMSDSQLAELMRLLQSEEGQMMFDQQYGSGQANRFLANIMNQDMKRRGRLDNEFGQEMYSVERLLNMLNQ
jgi:hypothetical protein